MRCLMLEIAVSHTTSLTLPRVRSFIVAVIFNQDRNAPHFFGDKSLT